MKILSFDTEEWYIEKINFGGREFRYKELDDKLFELLDELDKHKFKATFFCLGQLAKEYPDRVRWISDRGHEIGCHTNTHKWLNKMTPEELLADTTEALSRLEDLTGKKVESFRAPAFSISADNKWALEVLVDCGIKYDASIFPSSRDFGGFGGLNINEPCILEYNKRQIKEFPISLANVLGRNMAFSGGGYFRLFPYWALNMLSRNKDYVMWYFHLADLIQMKFKMKSKEEYEAYFKEPGTLKNRLLRYIKSNIGSNNAYQKLTKLLSSDDFVSVDVADKMIDWSTANTIKL